MRRSRPGRSRPGPLGSHDPLGSLGPAGPSGSSWRAAGPGRPPRRRSRLTRRGRLLLFLAMLAGTGFLVLVPRLTGGDAPPEQPRRLLVPEGWRAPQVYAAVDRALGLAPGTTRAAVPRAGLALPPEAKGNPEGFLFPATYPVTSKTTPEGLLRYMVDTANARLAGAGIAGAGRAQGMTPYQVATLASVIEAEADAPADRPRVARVIHNRLARSMPLQMDSTLNYALDRHTLDVSLAETRLDSPFNTYRRQGLPPTPIGNPGLAALRAAVSPAAGDWLFSVTVRPGDTRFSATYEEHRQHVAAFNAERRAAKAGTG
ncbi:endolytic transglycosylase MltG [Streptomyces sp. NPDC086023]|uniref:endolytic transglycosylase MltG n=1 Tax=Streptomyces sp. NPDC086023 TaxID=3365746 RepID=UPI0037D04B17